MEDSIFALLRTLFIAQGMDANCVLSKRKSNNEVSLISHFLPLFSHFSPTFLPLIWHLNTFIYIQWGNPKIGEIV